MVADIASDGTIETARQSRRRSGRGHSGTVDPAFAYDWVRRQTGDAEIRTVAVLVVGLRSLPANLTSDAFSALTLCFSTAVREIVEAHGGVLAPGRPASRLIAYWGTEAGQEPDVTSALAAAQAVVAAPELSERVSAVLDAGPAYIEFADGSGDRSISGVAHVTALATENALALQFTTRPGEIVSTPAADMLGRALEALAPGAKQAHSSESTHSSSTGNCLGPGARWSASDEVSIQVLAHDVPCGDLLPGARAAIARAADGNPDLALEIGRAVALGFAQADSLLTIVETPNPISLMINRQCDALGPARFLLRAAAVCGEIFDSAVLADALDISLDQLVSPLDALVAAGLLQRGTPLGVGARGRRAPMYKFFSRLVCAVAATSLPAGRRQALHARIGQAMATLRRPAPEAVARHFTAAGNTAAAITWWRRAAERAIADSAAHAAVAHLKAALTHVSELDNDAGGAGAIQSGAIQKGTASELTRLLGPQLAATQGNAATDVLSNYVRTAQLGDQRETADLSARFDVLWGLLSCHLVRGEMRTASTIARQLMACAEASGERAHLLLAHRMTGLWCFLSGRLRAATRHYEWVLSHYDHRQHADLRFTYASDQSALTNAHLAWTHTLAGSRRDANAAGRSALAHAERLKHPHTTAHTVCVLAAAHMMAREYDAAMPLAMAGRAVAQKHAFPYWAAWSAIIMAGVEKIPGSSRRHSAIAEAIESYKAIGATQALPFAHALLGERLLDAGRPSDALAALDEGLQFSHTSGVAVFDPNLLHLYGRAAQQAGRADFDAYFDRAERRARRAGALLWVQQISASRFVTDE